VARWPSRRCCPVNRDRTGALREPTGCSSGWPRLVTGRMVKPRSTPLTSRKSRFRYEAKSWSFAPGPRDVRHLDEVLHVLVVGRHVESHVVAHLALEPRLVGVVRSGLRFGLPTRSSSRLPSPCIRGTVRDVEVLEVRLLIELA